MKVVSFVPSLTETLIECGVEVVGRTRFCVHPAQAVKKIPVVGGTKDANWEKVKTLKPDLVVFDREENRREMAEACPVETFDTHVTSLDSLSHELKRLGEKLQNSKLTELAGLAQVTAQSRRPKDIPSALPVLKWLTPAPSDIKTVLYMIWKEPWMAVSRDTFIGSVLKQFGFELPIFEKKYPEIDLKNFDRKTTLLLFSSEPFPFQKHEKDVVALGFPAAIVDGESYSWFGIRSLLFLLTSQNIPHTFS